MSGGIAAIDFAGIAPDRLERGLLQRARLTWLERMQTEHWSAQLMELLLEETLASGDPFEARAHIEELIAEERHHASLCEELARALGAEPGPRPPAREQPEAFQKMTPAQRALAIAISMLVVNETLSVGYIRDLHARCRNDVVHAVLSATLADEAEHDAFGVEHVRRGLERQSPAALTAWRKLALDALRPQQTLAQTVLQTLPSELRQLDSWNDEREVELGLFSRERQALVFERTRIEILEPRLRDLGLW